MTSLSYIITIGTVLYYHCTVLVARPTEKRVRQTLLLSSAANWSLRRPPRLDRPEAVCLVPSSVQVQLPVSVHRLTCATLCSFSFLLRAPKLTFCLGSFFAPSSKLFPHLPTSRKHSSLVLWSGSVGGCIRDTVGADRGLGSRAERMRCFGLEFVRNIFCPEIRPIEALG